MSVLSVLAIVAAFVAFAINALGWVAVSLTAMGVIFLVCACVIFFDAFVAPRLR